MRLIDADQIHHAKYHGIAEIYPSDVDVEAYKRGWNDALDAVADPSCSPTIDAVPVRQGEWIQEDIINVYEAPKNKYDALRPYFLSIAQCSKCKCYVYDFNAVDKIKVLYRYCPNCGATMERKEE